MSDIDPSLFYTLDCLSRDPYFCGSQLAQLREEKGQTPKQQADDLGITLQRLEFLALSRHMKRYSTQPPSGTIQGPCAVRAGR